MITKFTSYNESVETIRKTITIPNLEKFIGKTRDESTVRNIVNIQNKFKERIINKYVVIRTLWNQIVENEVIDVIFHIHSNGESGIINRITVKLYMEDGHNHNVRQGGKMYIIPPKISWFKDGNLEEGW